MKVQLLEPRSGVDAHGNMVVSKKGDIVTVASNEGARMIERNQAIPVQEPKPKRKKASAKR